MGRVLEPDDVLLGSLDLGEPFGGDLGVRVGVVTAFEEDENYWGELWF
jgi:hypothetical protein